MTDKNTFFMPFIKSSKFAAEKIYSGLIKQIILKFISQKLSHIWWRLFKYYLIGYILDQ